MGIAKSLYDWLGQRLGEGSASDSVSGVLGGAANVAMTDVAFRICVGYVSAAISKANFVKYEGGKRIEKSWDEYAWTISPNMNQTQADFIDKLVWNTFRHGKSVVIPHGGSLYVADAVNAPTKSLFAEDVYENLSVDGNSVPGSMRASELFVFQAPDGRVAKLMESMNSSYSGMLAAAERYYKERTGKKYKLKLASTKAAIAGQGDSYAKFIENDLKPFMNAENAILPEYTGYDLQPLYGSQPMAGMASDFVSIRKDCFEAVAMAMRMPVSMLYGNVNNFDSVFQSFITMAVQPVATMMEREITRKMCSWGGWKVGDQFRIDLSRIKHFDIFDAAESADKLIASSVFSVNDILRSLGLDEIQEPWANEHYLTKNYSLAREAQTLEGGERE